MDYSDRYKRFVEVLKLYVNMSKIWDEITLLYPFLPEYPVLEIGKPNGSGTGVELYTTDRGVLKLYVYPNGEYTKDMEYMVNVLAKEMCLSWKLCCVTPEPFDSSKMGYPKYLRDVADSLINKFMEDNID